MHHGRGAYSVRRVAPGHPKSAMIGLLINRYCSRMPYLCGITVPGWRKGGGEKNNGFRSRRTRPDGHGGKIRRLRRNGIMELLNRLTSPLPRIISGFFRSCTVNALQYKCTVFSSIFDIQYPNKSLSGASSQRGPPRMAQIVSACFRRSSRTPNGIIGDGPRSWSFRRREA